MSTKKCPSTKKFRKNRVEVGTDYGVPYTYIPDDAKLAIMKSRRVLEGIKDIYDDYDSVFTLQQFKSIESCLIFAQECAGSAVCITPTGIILTCSHCLEDEDEQPPDMTTRKTLIFADGTIVVAQCIAFSVITDVALLQIIGKYVPQSKNSTTKTSHTSNTATSCTISHHHRTKSTTTNTVLAPPPNSKKKRSTALTDSYIYVPLNHHDTRSSSSTGVLAVSDETLRFPYIPILPSPYNPIRHQTCYCVGQPGQDDLESTSARRTGYSYIYCSEGSYLGIKDDDGKHTTTATDLRQTTTTNDAIDRIMNNYDIGQLKHDCWTYWGHSGAPIFITINQANTTKTVLSSSSSSSLSSSSSSKRARSTVNRYSNSSASKSDYPNLPEDNNLMLIGLHSSWDDQTGVRHGIHIEAIRRFIESVLPSLPKEGATYLSSILSLPTVSSTLTNNTTGSDSMNNIVKNEAKSTEGNKNLVKKYKRTIIEDTSASSDDQCVKK